MPNNVLKSLSKKHGISVKKIEKYWSLAKEAAVKKGLEGVSKYKYAMAIVKRRLGGSVTSSLLMEVIAGVENMELARPNSNHSISLTNAGRMWAKTHLVDNNIEDQGLVKSGDSITIENREFSVILIYPKMFNVNNLTITERFKALRRIDKVGRIVLGNTRISTYTLSGHSLRTLAVPLCSVVLLQTDNLSHNHLENDIGL